MMFIHFVGISRKSNERKLKSNVLIYILQKKRDLFFFDIRILGVKLAEAINYINHLMLIFPQSHFSSSLNIHRSSGNRYFRSGHFLKRCVLSPYPSTFNSPSPHFQQTIEYGNQAMMIQPMHHSQPKACG
jgi:hypothetical protein